MMQNMEVCKEQWMAELLLVSGVKAARTLTLRAFGRIVLQILLVSQMSQKNLLLRTAKPFTLTYTEGNVIQSVMRKKSSS